MLLTGQKEEEEKKYNGDTWRKLRSLSKMGSQVPPPLVYEIRAIAFFIVMGNYMEINCTSGFLSIGRCFQTSEIMC